MDPNFLLFQENPLRIYTEWIHSHDTCKHHHLVPHHQFQTSWQKVCVCLFSCDSDDPEKGVFLLLRQMVLLPNS